MTKVTGAGGGPPTSDSTGVEGPVSRYVTTATNPRTPNSVSTPEPKRRRRWASGKASSRDAVPM